MRGEDYFIDGKFAPNILVEELISDTVENYLNTPITEKGGDVIWKYHAELGIFKPDGISYVEKRSKDALGVKAKAHRVAEVVKLTKIATYTTPENFEEDPNIIVLENGSYHIDTGELTSYNATHDAKTRLEINFDPKADCPKIKEFLTEVIPHDIETFQEWLGYHFVKSMPFQKACMLVGDGENGKSTLQNLVLRFLNPENVSNATLFDLVSNRFAVADLHLKLANISPDIASDELKRTGKFKALTGNDRIRAEKKNRDAFHFRNYAKLTFLTNQLPRTPDETRAFFRRWIIITCPNTFTGDQCDPHILEKLTTPQELSGLFNWAIEGLQRLNKNGGFTKSKTADEIQIQYELLSNPVKAFILNCLELDGDTVTPKDDTYNAYHQFCRMKGYAPILKQTLSKEIKPLIPGMNEGRRNIRGKRAMSWIGIQLNCTTPHPGCQGCQRSIPPSRKSFFDLRDLPLSPVTPHPQLIPEVF